MIQQRRLLVFWVATIMFFVGLTPQLKADVGSKSNEDDWAQTNGPYGGEINTLYATPEGILFAGTGSAGIFCSTDLGNSWTPANTGLPDASGDGLSAAVYAQKGDTLYAGSGELYASTDGGDAWHHVPILQKRVSVSGVVIIGDRIYIGTLEDGVWYSDDDGESWIPMNDGLGNLIIRVLSRIGTTLVAGTENGVFRKKANEDVWTPINAGFVKRPTDMEQINSARIASGLKPLQRHFLSGLRVDSFATLGNLLYMGIHTGGDDDGLFRSDDEGDSWTRITSKEMVHTVEALTAFGTTLYASTFGGGVFRSEDKGDSWITVNDGLTDLTVSALLAVSEDTVFVGTLDGGGIFRTTDGGNSWVEANTGLMNTPVSELAVIENTIYAGIGHRLLYSVDGGESWQPVKTPPMPIEYHFSALSVSGGKLYIAATRFAPRSQGGVVGGIFRLDAETHSLIELNTDSELYGIECLEIVGLTFYVGTQRRGVFRWTPGLDSWTNLGLEGNVVTALSVHRKKIYAGTQRGGIFRLDGVGKPWQFINSTDMTSDFISDFRWVESTLYAATAGKGIFRSTNNGKSWTPLNDGLKDLSVMTITADDTNTYIGTYYDGVFRWIDNRKRWERMGSLRRRTDSLVIHNDSLYAGTVGGGVFKIPIKKKTN
ncbi:hypothetical protein C6500_20025 [Candidatus Poribacteria bacterium]|nr:MAG: hypothetical protein C6500_20025 [Candidatus Poribacteria bacterium]